jgi:hypothetical protein
VLVDDALVFQDAVDQLAGEFSHTGFGWLLFQPLCQDLSGRMSDTIDFIEGFEGDAPGATTRLHNQALLFG